MSVSECVCVCVCERERERERERESNAEQCTSHEPELEQSKRGARGASEKDAGEQLNGACLLQALGDDEQDADCQDPLLEILKIQ